MMPFRLSGCFVGFFHELNDLLEHMATDQLVIGQAQSRC